MDINRTAHRFRLRVARMLADRRSRSVPTVAALYPVWGVFYSPALGRPDARLVVPYGPIGNDYGKRALIGPLFLQEDLAWVTHADWVDANATLGFGPEEDWEETLLGFVYGERPSDTEMEEMLEERRRVWRIEKSEDELFGQLEDGLDAAYREMTS